MPQLTNQFCNIWAESNPACNQKNNQFSSPTFPNATITKQILTLTTNKRGDFRRYFPLPQLYSTRFNLITGLFLHAYSVRWSELRTGLNLVNATRKFALIPYKHDINQIRITFHMGLCYFFKSKARYGCACTFSEVLQ